MEKAGQAGLPADLALLVMANVIWGSTDAAAKYALSEMTPGSLLWMRLSIALLAFAPALWLRRNEIPAGFRGLAPFLALGACGFFLDFLLVYHGLKLAPASHATAFRVSEVLAIVILSALILREKVGWRALLGLVLGVLGVVLVLGLDFKNLALYRSGARLGDLLIIAGICVESLYTVIGKRVLQSTSPLVATGLAVFFGWALVTIFLGIPASRELAAHPPSPGAMLACLYLGLIALSLVYWIYYRVLSRRDSHRVAIAIMIQPVVGIPLAAVLFHEPMTRQFLSGAALIALGVYFALAVGTKVPRASPMPDPSTPIS